MNKKQVIGLVIAAVIFMIVGSVSTLLHVLLKDNFNLSMDGLGFDSSYDGWDDEDYYDEDGYDYGLPEEEFIALVEVEGEITQSGYDDYYYGYGSYDHEWTLSYIDELIENTSNRGLLLYIDSGGGGAYESDELYLKLMKYKEETGRPVWAYMASEACSGGYYIAMASDKIYCNRNGMTGSIGVIMTLSDYTELMKKLGISEINIKSGENKAMGAETEKLTEEQREIFQSIVDETYEQFIQVVAKGRNMTEEEVRQVGDGRIYTPKQALELNLIDEIAAYEEMEAAFKEELGIEVIASNMTGGQEFKDSVRMDSNSRMEMPEEVRFYQNLMRWQKVGRPMYEAQ